MWGEYFAGSSAIAATERGDVVGFVLGFAVPDRPGLGVSLNPETVAKYRIG